MSTSANEFRRHAGATHSPGDPRSAVHAVSAKSTRSVAVSMVFPQASSESNSNETNIHSTADRFCVRRITRLLWLA